MSVRITTRGLDDLKRYFERLPEVANTAARMAINDTLAFAKTEGSRRIRKDINFKPGYLQDNLTIARKASDNRLEGEIVGRDRPTSLARFATGNPTFGRRKKGSAIKVNVSPDGGTRTIPDAFYMRLRRGKSIEGDSFNIGLAIRLKPGETIRNKREMVAFSKGLYLLYGPSVGQVFDDVAIDMEPMLSDRMEDEFVRQFNRLEP
jgi:hypothetical protein